jgi:hypothetical protein
MTDHLPPESVITFDRNAHSAYTAARAIRTERPKNLFQVLARRVVIVVDRIAKIDLRLCHARTIPIYSTNIGIVAWYVKLINPIIAIIISISSVIVVYVQTNAVKEQLKITGLQIRPYVRYLPDFRASPKNWKKQKAVIVTMIEQNLSPIPACVFYTQMTPWINGVAGAWVHSPSRRVLYEHKGGASVLPFITGESAQLIIDGRSALMIGTCVIYGSTAATDDRRWEERALYS